MKFEQYECRGRGLKVGTPKRHNFDTSYIYEIASFKRSWRVYKAKNRYFSRDNTAKIILKINKNCSRVRRIWSKKDLYKYSNISGKKIHIIHKSRIYKYIIHTIHIFIHKYTTDTIQCDNLYFREKQALYNSYRFKLIEKVKQILNEFTIQISIEQWSGWIRCVYNPDCDYNRIVDIRYYIIMFLNTENLSFC